MYPRGLQLSEEFREAYRAELIRLAEAGQCPGKLCEKVNKALMIHYNEHSEQLNEITKLLAMKAAEKLADKVTSDDSEEEVKEGYGKKKKHSGG